MLKDHERHLQRLAEVADRSVRTVSRREFLGGLLTTIALLGGADKIFGGMRAAAKQSSPVVPRDPVCSVALNPDLYRATIDAVELLGGMDKIVKPDDSVFIKPNYVWSGYDGDPLVTGENTHPEVVLAVTEMCLIAGASQVVIGETSCHRPMVFERFSKEYHWLGLGVAEGVEKLNAKYGKRVRLVDLKAEAPYYVFIPSKTNLRYLAIPYVMMASDRIISVPVMKTHNNCGTSLSMKNFVGAMPVSLYGDPRFVLHECDLEIEQCFLDVCLALQPDLAVVDGSIGMEGEGPHPSTGGTGVDVRERSRTGKYMVFAGTNLPAVDATVSRVMGHDPWKLRYLRLAFEQGYGEIQQNKIEVVGAKIDDIKMPWKPSISYPQ